MSTEVITKALKNPVVLASGGGTSFLLMILYSLNGSITRLNGNLDNFQGVAESVNGLKVEVSKLSENFSKANATLATVSEGVKNNESRLDRHSQKIETLNSFHVK